MSKPNVLFVGDACVPSGFAACTHAACDALHADGWEVNVLGMGYNGDPHTYSYKIWPTRSIVERTYDYFGLDRLPNLVATIKPDVVVILNDPWNVWGYAAALKRADLLDKVKLVGWLAVDSRNHRWYEQKQVEAPDDELGCVTESFNTLNYLDHMLVWTEFGLETMIESGYEGTYGIVPLGVDTSIFYPR